MVDLILRTLHRHASLMGQPAPGRQSESRAQTLAAIPAAPFRLRVVLLQALSAESWHALDSPAGVQAFLAASTADLETYGIRCGSTPRSEIFRGLLRVAGATSTQARNHPNPTQIATGLLEDLVAACDQAGRHWREGVEELARRKCLPGSHAIAWRLRDMGFLPMARIPRSNERLPLFS